MHPIISNILHHLSVVLFPPKCIKCNKIIDSYGNLCSNCWSSIEFITDPMCKICGVPFEFDMDIDLICGQCAGTKQFFDHAISIFKYDENSKNLIYKFKYNDKTYLSKYFAKWIYKNIHTSINDYQYIVPVPLHRKRMRKRFYNQSSLIASYLAKLSKKTFLPNLLIKNRYDVPQTSLTKKQRLKNVKSSFAINPKLQSKIEGTKILLIDDVYTTGSTLNECSKILKKNGCNQITAVTLARVCK